MRLDEEVLQRQADKYNVAPDRRFTDYHDLCSCPDVDAVEVCTPNYLHIPCAMAAVDAGKAINVEKPFALNREQAQPLMELIARKPVPNMMCFSYRFSPTAQYAKHLKNQGELGDIVSVNIEYLKDSGLWEGRPFAWRFDKQYAGSGVLCDLGSHLVDLVRYLVGDIKEVCADKATVVKERPLPDQPMTSVYWSNANVGDMMPVTTDDYCHFTARMDNESWTLVNFTVFRAASGEGNHVRFDIYGTKGMISFDPNNSSVLGVCMGKEDMKTRTIRSIPAPENFCYTQEQTFVATVKGEAPAYLPDLAPTLKDGFANQKILDAVLQSAEEHRWVTID